MFLPEIRFCGPDDVPAIIEANGLSLYPWPDAVIARDLAASSSEQTREARSMGRTRLILRVGEANAPARALYEGLSFRRGATRARYYSDGENAVEMVLLLPRAL